VALFCMLIVAAVAARQSINHLQNLDAEQSWLFRRTHLPLRRTIAFGLTRCEDSRAGPHSTMGREVSSVQPFFYSVPTSISTASLDPRQKVLNQNFAADGDQHNATKYFCALGEGFAQSRAEPNRWQAKRKGHAPDEGDEFD